MSSWPFLIGDRRLAAATCPEPDVNNTLEKNGNQQQIDKIE
jgi:hypothetical protein